MQIVFTKRYRMLVNSIKIGIVAGAFVAATFSVTEPKVEEKQEIRLSNSIDQDAPPTLQMYKHIKAYADTFNIPLRYALGIANTETGYRGPFHWKYNPALTSSANAVGPMQIMQATARYINHENVSVSKLRNDIEYNVMTSMKLLRKLHNLYGDWQTTFGAYNCGYPCINGYAVQVYNHQINWK